MNLKYILIIVILATFVGGGILTYQYWLAPKEEIKSPEVKTPPEEVPIDETANWKTYRDEKYSFTFKYPAETEVIKDTSPRGIEYKIIGKNGFEQLLFISTDNYPSDKFFQELLDWRPKTWISSNKTIISGYDAVEMLFDDYGKIIKEIYIGKDNLVIVFQFSLDSLESKISPERQNILNSFRFLE